MPKTKSTDYEALTEKVLVRRDSRSELVHIANRRKIVTTTEIRNGKPSKPFTTRRIATICGKALKSPAFLRETISKTDSEYILPQKLKIHGWNNRYAELIFCDKCGTREDFQTVYREYSISFQQFQQQQRDEFEQHVTKKREAKQHREDILKQFLSKLLYVNGIGTKREPV